MQKKNAPYVALFGNAMHSAQLGQMFDHAWIPAAMSLLQLHKRIDFQTNFDTITHRKAGLDRGNNRLLFFGLTCIKK